MSPLQVGVVIREMAKKAGVPLQVGVVIREVAKKADVPLQVGGCHS